MARIRDSRRLPSENSAYTRLLGNPQLGQLLSRVQAAVIRQGNELEALVEQSVPTLVKTTIAEILADPNAFAAGAVPRIQAVFGHHLPVLVQAEAEATSRRGSTIDLVIFDHEERRLTVVELKDGHVFDTKKADGERTSMTAAAARLRELTGYASAFALCGFNADSRDDIIYGAKERFSLEEVMTGRELCALLSVDYDALRRGREAEQPENLRYFISELIEIDEVRAFIYEALGLSGRAQERTDL